MHNLTRPRVTVLLVATLCCCTQLGLTAAGERVRVVTALEPNCHAGEAIDVSPVCVSPQEAEDRRVSKRTRDLCRLEAEQDLRNAAGALGMEAILIEKSTLLTDGRWRARASSYTCSTAAPPTIGESTASAKVPNSTTSANVSTAPANEPPPPAPATNDTSAATDRVKVGAGVSLGGDLLLGGDTEAPLTSIRLPILGKSMRLEPEVSFLRVALGDTTANVLNLGAGISLTSRRGEKTLLYMGLRGGVRFLFETGADDDERTDVYAGPIAGAEYFLSAHVSLGAEIQLTYLGFGDWNNDETDDSSSHAVSTGGAVLVRFYVD